VVAKEPVEEPSPHVSRLEGPNLLYGCKKE
jgi:hypothetical protein